MLIPAHSSATRRLPLSFDKNGNPYYQTVCSPLSFKQRSLAVVPNRHVIPVIFVPGIMGTNLRGAANSIGHKNKPAWRPPNGIGEGWDEGRSRSNQKPADRQKQLNPATTVVDTEGSIVLPHTLYTVTEEEARRRGWGELHWDSYGEILTHLEMALNDRNENAGKIDAKKMAAWTIAETLKKAQKDVRFIWNQVKGETSPLTLDEYKHMSQYHYPVWACGYNWLQSNEQSAQRLVKKIDEVLAWYDKTGYFIPEGKVILVTHSMGGLVARRAAQQAGDKILGVVHGVQPVGGAPVVYRRFRAGTEVNGRFDLLGAVAATIFGWDSADMTCVAASSPGLLELLPTKHYHKHWLKVEQENEKGHRKTLFELPESDPYAEIYAKRTQDVWWGMVDEPLIDPANIHEGNNIPAWDAYKRALTQARNFHDKLGLACHPNTYAHYGSDADQASFGNVRWITKSNIPDSAKYGLNAELARKWSTLGSTEISSNKTTITFKLDNKSKPDSDVSGNAGDGTVPSPSGALIKTGAKHVFQMKGFEHAASYKNKDVIENVLYCLGKIIQDATPVKNLPQKKGAAWSNSTAVSADSSSKSVSPPSPVAISGSTMPGSL